MKTLLTILLLIVIVLAGLFSLSLFAQKEYNLSSLLTITAYLSMVSCVYVLTNKKPALQ